MAMVETDEFAQLRKMSIDIVSFFEGALSGKIREGNENSEVQTEKKLLGSDQTSISRGLTERYSPADVAYFYIARELESEWLRHLMVGYKEFCEDVSFEEKYAGPESFCCNFIKKEG